MKVIHFIRTIISIYVLTFRMKATNRHYDT